MTQFSHSKSIRNIFYFFFRCWCCCLPIQFYYSFFFLIVMPSSCLHADKCLVHNFFSSLSCHSVDIINWNEQKKILRRTKQRRKSENKMVEQSGVICPIFSILPLARWFIMYIFFYCHFGSDTKKKNIFLMSKTRGEKHWH